MPSDIQQPQRSIPGTILRSLFFTKDPYAGLLLALGILLAAWPFCLWLLLFQLQGTILHRGWIVFCTCGGIGLYALSLLIVAFSNLLRERISRRGVRICEAIGCSILLIPCGVLALLTHAWRKRRWLSLGLLAIALLLFLIEVAAGFGALGEMKINYNYLINIKIFMLLLAIFLLPPRPTFRMAYTLIPLVIFAWVNWRFHVEDHRLMIQIDQQREAIAKLVGLPMELSDYRARVESGFSLEDEPLKSLIAHAKKLNEEPIKDLWPDTPADELASRYQDFLHDNAEFVQSLDAWLALPAQHIAHDWPDDTVYAILLPELATFRKGARFLALKMQANSDNPEIVRQCNHGLELLRDEALSGDTLISAMVGIAIEAIRIDALATTLDHAHWSREDWLALLGDEPDWNFHAMKAMADESSCFDDTIKYIWNAPDNLNKLCSGDEPSHIPSRHPNPALTFYRWILKFDSLFRMEFIRQNIEYLQQNPHPYDKIHALTQTAAKSLMERFFLLSGMLLPAIDKATMKFDVVHDRRRQAEVAWEIVHYRDTHDGQLPETLDFLGEIPTSNVTGKPFGYETGEVPYQVEINKAPHVVHGFRLSNTVYDMRDYPKEEQFHLVVPLKPVQPSNE
ncbi:MAG: hypothetical protein J5654_03925 [Victivallales bacterium]|nr:hypothetical protein [Victivallales bacterium]